MSASALFRSEEGGKLGGGEEGRAKTRRSLEGRERAAERRVRRDVKGEEGEEGGVCVRVWFQCMRTSILFLSVPLVSVTLKDR